MLLRALEELSAELVHNLPSLLLDLVLCDGVEEVPSIGQSICSEWTEFWKLELRAPDFSAVSVYIISKREHLLTQYVASAWTFYFDLETLASLDDTDFARLHVHRSKLGLDV